MIYHTLPRIALIFGRFGTVHPSERCSERVHFVEIARRLFSSGEQDVPSRPAPLRKIRVDVQPPKVVVVSFRQLPERARSARRHRKTIRYLPEKGIIVDVCRVVVLFLRELVLGDAEMRRYDTVNGREPLTLDVLFRRGQQHWAKFLRIGRGLVFACGEFGPQSRDGALASEGVPRGDKEEFGLERPRHGSIGLLEERFA